MKKLAYISLAVTMAFTFSACSSLNAGTNVKENENTNTNTNNGEVLVDDLEKVDFMDKDFDMSQIEQHSCCDE